MLCEELRGEGRVTGGLQCQLASKVHYKEGTDTLCSPMLHSTCTAGVYVQHIYLEVIQL